MKILQARQEQAGALAQLNDAVQKMHAAHHPHVFKYPADTAEVEGFFRDRIKSDGTFIFMATIAGRAVGYVWCDIQLKGENAFKYGQKRIYIHQISVEPQCRHRGVGRALMGSVENLARQNGISSFALDSWEFNKEDHAFFERLGFSRFNINFWRDGTGK